MPVGVGRSDGGIPSWRVVAVVAGVVVGAAIGATRLALHVHTIPEVLVGATVGSLGLISQITNASR